MTPSLMAWSALLILYAPTIASRTANSSCRVLLSLLLVPILLLPQQLKALNSRANELFERKIAALALELGIKDQLQIRNIFPSAEWAMSLSKAPIERNLSIFGHATIKDIRQLIGRSGSIKSPVQCLGSLEEHNAIPDDDRFVRIRGWLYQPERKTIPKEIRILDSDGKIVGSALTGQARPDVTKIIGSPTDLTGFKGYLERAQIGKPIVLNGLQPNCELRVVVRPPAYEVQQDVDDASGLNYIGTDAVIQTNEWRGADFQKTTIDGFKVMGSLIQSDQDIGSISLIGKRGNAIYYRSGPTGGKQLLAIGSGDKFSQVLPVAPEWTVLKFTNPALPESFVLTITDSGANWGEWSAVALVSNDE